MARLQLQFDANLIPDLSARYSYASDSRVRALSAQARARGWFTREEFIEICEWKTPRIRSKVALNTTAQIESATRRALWARHPRDAIRHLRSLHGVDFPVASVFLHFGHRDPYPLVDYRALEALGLGGEIKIGEALWLEYVEVTRRIAREAGVDMRTLDRALWQWSVEQGRTRRSNYSRTPAQETASRIRVPTTADLVVLGCVSTKLAGRAPAKDLYVSPLWRKRRAYAESTGKPWYIFSAKHGILRPEDVIEWYDVALARLGRAEQRRRGEEAAAQLESLFGPLRGATVEVHAGSAYSNAIRGPLLARGALLSEPLAGLTIGRQLQYYGLDR